MYSQVYWTRNNPIDLPPELVNSIGRKLFNLFPGKILCKKRQDLTWKILERKYFQKTNIFRDETFSGKNFFRWKDFKERWWPSLAMKLIRWFSIVDHLHQQIKQDNISFLPHNATYISKVTHTGDEKIKAESENSNEAGLSGFACYPDCSKSDKSVNKVL